MKCTIAADFDEDAICYEAHSPGTIDAYHSLSGDRAYRDRTQLALDEPIECWTLQNRPSRVTGAMTTAPTIGTL